MSTRWKIDDTTHPGRTLCEHLQKPRLTGELLSPDDMPERGFAIPAPGGLWLLITGWPEGIQGYEEQDMYDSLEAALKAHQASHAQPAAG
ncbi:MAG: hypothetical protein ABSG68_07845 [Thermoguttaceae bacterium]|jgi:hypothetical protein